MNMKHKQKRTELVVSVGMGLNKAYEGIINKIKLNSVFFLSIVISTNKWLIIKLRIHITSQRCSRKSFDSYLLKTLKAPTICHECSHYNSNPLNSSVHCDRLDLHFPSPSTPIHDSNPLCKTISFEFATVPCKNEGSAASLMSMVFYFHEKRWQDSFWRFKIIKYWLIKSIKKFDTVPVEPYNHKKRKIRQEADQEVQQCSKRRRKNPK